MPEEMALRDACWTLGAIAPIAWGDRSLAADASLYRAMILERRSNRVLQSEVKVDCNVFVARVYFCVAYSKFAMCPSIEYTSIFLLNC